MIPAIDQHIVDAGFAQFTERDFLRVGHVRQPCRGSSFVTGPKSIRPSQVLREFRMIRLGLGFGLSRLGPAAASGEAASSGKL